jgi:hypothetical protein
LRELVKQGYGFALVREGSKIDDELTTRPVAGVDWMVNIAVVYNLNAIRKQFQFS